MFELRCSCQKLYNPYLFHEHGSHCGEECERCNVLFRALAVSLRGQTVAHYADTLQTAAFWWNVRKYEVLGVIQAQRIKNYSKQTGTVRDKVEKLQLDAEVVNSIWERFVLADEEVTGGTYLRWSSEWRGK